MNLRLLLNPEDSVLQGSTTGGSNGQALHAAPNDSNTTSITTDTEKPDRTPHKVNQPASEANIIRQENRVARSVGVENKRSRMNGQQNSGTDISLTPEVIPDAGTRTTSGSDVQDPSLSIVHPTGWTHFYASTPPPAPTLKHAPPVEHITRPKRGRGRGLSEPYTPKEVQHIADFSSWMYSACPNADFTAYAIELQKTMPHRTLNGLRCFLSKDKRIKQLKALGYKHEELKMRSGRGVEKTRRQTRTVQITQPLPEVVARRESASDGKEQSIGAPWTSAALNDSNTTRLRIEPEKASTTPNRWEHSSGEGVFIREDERYARSAAIENHNRWEAPEEGATSYQQHSSGRDSNLIREDNRREGGYVLGEEGDSLEEESDESDEEYDELDDEDEE